MDNNPGLRPGSYPPLPSSDTDNKSQHMRFHLRPICLEFPTNKLRRSTSIIPFATIDLYTTNSQIPSHLIAFVRVQLPRNHCNVPENCLFVCCHLLLSLFLIHCKTTDFSKCGQIDLNLYENSRIPRHLIGIEAFSLLIFLWWIVTNTRSSAQA